MEGDKLKYLTHIFEARRSLIEAVNCMEYSSEIGVIMAVIDLLNSYSRAYSDRHNVNHG